MKKVLSLVLALAMVLSSMSFAFAATFEDVTDAATSQAVDALSSLGVVKGNPDGTFKPENSITRAEMAAMLVRALGHSDLAAGSSSSFKDAKGKWYDGEVAIAQSIGLTDGYPDGTFKGDNQVSYTEAITMILRALGYNNRAVNSNRAEAYNATAYKTTAARLGVLKNVVLETGAANRGDVAKMLYNSLEVQVVVPNEDGNPVGQWLVAPAVGTTGTVRTLLDDVAKRDANFQVSVAQLYNGHVADLSAYLGQNVVAYKNYNDKVVFVKESNNYVTEGTLANVTANSLRLYLADGTYSSYFTVPTGASIIVNQKVSGTTVLTTAGIESDAIPSGIVGTWYDGDTVKVIRDKDTLAVQAIVIDHADNLIQVNSKYVAGQKVFSGITLPVDKYSKLDLTKVFVEGAADSLEDIEKGDVVQVYRNTSNSYVKFIVTRDVLEGTVTKVQDTDYAYVDGTKYYINPNNGLSNLNMLGYAYTFYLDKDENIAFAVRGNSASTSAVNYGLINTTTNPGTTTTAFGNQSVGVYPKVKITGTNGEEKIYEVAVSVTSTGALSSTPAGFTTTATSGIQIAVNTGTVVNGTHNLVAYTLDKNGRVSSIERVPTVQGTAKKTNANFRADENTVILNEDNKFSVVSLDNIGTQDLTYIAVMNGTTWDIVVVTAGLETTASSTYALVKAVNPALNANGVRTNEVTVLLNGETKTYYTVPSAGYSPQVNTVSALTFNSNGELTLSTPQSQGVTTTALDGSVFAATNKTVVGFNGNLLTLSATDGTSTSDTAYFSLADDVVIYGLKANVAQSGVRTAANIMINNQVTGGGSRVTLFDSNSDGVIDIIVIHE